MGSEHLYYSRSSHESYGPLLVILTTPGEWHERGQIRHINRYDRTLHAVHPYSEERRPRRDPVQRPAPLRHRARPCGPGRGQRQAQRRRTLHQALQPLDRGPVRHPEVPAHHQRDHGTRDGRAHVRHRTGRRGHPAQLHLLLHRQRVRPGRRKARLRRHPPGYHEHRRDQGRGGRNRTHAGHLRHALRRGRLRNGRHHGHRPAPRPARGRRRRPGGHGQLPRACPGDDWRLWVLLVP